jgi:hypothetical protein
MNAERVLDTARTIMIAGMVAVIAAVCMASATTSAAASGRHGSEVVQATAHASAAHPPGKKEW